MNKNSVLLSRSRDVQSHCQTIFQFLFYSDPAMSLLRCIQFLLPQNRGFAKCEVSKRGSGKGYCFTVGLFLFCHTGDESQGLCMLHARDCVSPKIRPSRKIICLENQRTSNAGAKAVWYSRRALQRRNNIWGAASKPSLCAFIFHPSLWIGAIYTQVGAPIIHTPNPSITVLIHMHMPNPVTFHTSQL